MRRTAGRRGDMDTGDAASALIRDHAPILRMSTSWHGSQMYR